MKEEKTPRKLQTSQAACVCDSFFAISVAILFAGAPGDDRGNWRVRVTLGLKKGPSYDILTKKTGALRASGRCGNTTSDDKDVRTVSLMRIF